MLDPSEYPLDKAAPAPGAVRRRFPTPWLLAAGVVLAGGAAVWFFVTGRQAPPPVAEQPAPIAAPPPPVPRTLCETTDVIALPSLDDSDAFVAKLVRALSTHRRVVAWLATDNLIRNFTVVIENVSNGISPARHLQALRPAPTVSCDRHKPRAGGGSPGLCAVRTNCRRSGLGGCAGCGAAMRDAEAAPQ